MTSLFQAKTKEESRKSNEGHKALAKMFQNFRHEDSLTLQNFNAKKLIWKPPFLSKNAVYHKNCFSKYEQYHYDRLKPPAPEESRGPDGSNCSNDESYHSSAKRCKRGSFSLGEIICCFCSENDTSSNFCVAGIMHEKYEKVNKHHVEELTLKLKTMATFLDENALLAKLSTGDIVANELYYHKKCYNAFLNKFNQKKTNDENREYFNLKENEDFIKAVCFNQLLT